MRAKELSFEGVVNLAFENNPPSGPNALPHEVQREALAKLERFGRHQFDYIIVDEFHHASAKSYRALIDYFQPKFLLGLTATPERTDGGGLRVLGTRRSALGTRHSGLGTAVPPINAAWRRKRLAAAPVELGTCKLYLQVPGEGASPIPRPDHGLPLRRSTLAGAPFREAMAAALDLDRNRAGAVEWHRFKCHHSPAVNQGLAFFWLCVGDSLFLS